MRRVGLKITESPSVDDDDRAAMSAALTRLYGVATQSAQEIVANLTESERARLAVFCYGRAHLNAIGLAIATTCSLDHLVAAAHSGTAGRTIFNQARDRSILAAKAVPGRRASVTLAASAMSRGLPAEAVESVA